MFWFCVDWGPGAYAATLAAGVLLLLAGVLLGGGWRARRPVRVCPNEACRHPNQPNARYCAQCGRPLSADDC